MTELLMRGPQADELIARRRGLGIDTYDEVWDGVYHVTPAGTGEHGALQAGLLALLRSARRDTVTATGPVNIGTERDYRVPDAALVPRRLIEQVWIAEALLVGEVLSDDDDTYVKFEHYRERGVEEIVVVDPRGRRVEVWQRDEVAGYRQVPLSRVLAGMTAGDIWAEISG